MVLVLALAACKREDARVDPHGFAVDPVGTTPSTHSTHSTQPTQPTDGTTPDPSGTSGDTAATSSTSTPGLPGYIGSPCRSDADCPYDGGVCLLESQGFPNGTCSAPCDQYCDDATGYPTTFCTQGSDLPSSVSPLGAGDCLSRCDFGIYPFTGCRPDYGCVKTGRANDPGTETYTCMPNVQSDLSDCIADLASRGVPFSPTTHGDEHPAEDPSATCHIEEPIMFGSGYQGVAIAYDTDAPAPVLAGCAMGQALATSIEEIAAEGVVTLHHLGTYNCRAIAGSTTISQHAFANAIDMQGFDFANGDSYVVEFDWEKDDPTPATAGGQWLYDTAHRWHDELVWNVILTPDYNADHYNHFHVDLTPGDDFLGFTTKGGYLGPLPNPEE